MRPPPHAAPREPGAATFHLAMSGLRSVAPCTQPTPAVDDSGAWGHPWSMPLESKPALAGTRVLVVDDEKNIRATLAVCLEALGCRVVACGTADSALEGLEREPFDVAFLDLRLGETNGLDLLPRLLAARAGLSVVVITAYATIETAVEAIRRGAVDYLPKPFTPAQIRHVVEQIAQAKSSARRIAELEQQLSGEVPEADL